VGQDLSHQEGVVRPEAAGEGLTEGGERAPGFRPQLAEKYASLSARIQQFNRKARKVRKGTCCIQGAGAEEIGGTSRKVLVRVPSWLDESWRVFAIFAVLAVRFLGSVCSMPPWCILRCLAHPRAAAPRKTWLAYLEIMQVLRGKLGPLEGWVGDGQESSCRSHRGGAEEAGRLNV